jgi:hypothetical protein
MEWIVQLCKLTTICPPIFKALRNGNFALYSEIAWQHEAYRIGGICLMEYHKNILSNDGVDPSLGNQRLLNSWKQIDQGVKSGNSELVWLGNKNMLHYEQSQFLQHVSYDPFRSAWKIASESTFPVFKPEFKSPIPTDPIGFQTYILRHRADFNCFTNTCMDLGNVVQRWGNNAGVEGWILAEISKLPN